MRLKIPSCVLWTFPWDEKDLFSYFYTLVHSTFETFWRFCSIILYMAMFIYSLTSYTTSTSRNWSQTTTIYILRHQRHWMFDVLVCPLMATERFLLQPLVSGTVFRRMLLLPTPLLSASSAVVLNHISSHFLIPLSDYSVLCTVPAQWLIILETIIVITFNT